jgi:hypothetical protein
MMSENPTSIESFVNVPVPASRVQEVYALLAAPAADDVRGSATESSDWTVELVKQLYFDSGDSMRHLLKVVAAANGDEVSTNEIADELDLPNGARSVAGMTGAAGRRVSSRYGMSGLPWLTRWRYIDPADQSKGTETLIWMPTWVCEVISSI